MRGHSLFASIGLLLFLTVRQIVACEAANSQDTVRLIDGRPSIAIHALKIIRNCEDPLIPALRCGLNDRRRVPRHLRHPTPTDESAP